MRPIQTQDGSWSFFSEAVEEGYHSYIGAYTEALEKYVQPTHVAEIAKQGSLRILDVCFGLGYNTAVALEKAWASHPEAEIHVVALENDARILAAMKTISFPPALAGIYQKYLIPAVEQSFFQSKQFSFKLLLGDARKTIEDVFGQFDCIFFDPFSPQKMPEMWAACFLAKVRQRLAGGGILATYSWAKRVRQNFLAAGFEIREGPRCNRRNGGVLASLPQQ